MTSLELTTRDELQADTSQPSKQSWLDSLAESAEEAIDSAGRTVSEYASAAATQATSYYNQAEATLEAVSDSVEKKGVTTTFWNYAAPIRRVAIDNLVKPVIGNRAATVLEKSADIFMNAPDGEGIESVGEYFGKEFAPELNLAAKTWDDFSGAITPEDHSLGAYYKAFVRGADYVYDLGLSDDPFGITQPKLPTITFGESAPLSPTQSDLTEPTDFEALSAEMPMAMLDQDETIEPTYLYQTETADEGSWEASDTDYSGSLSFAATEDFSFASAPASDSQEVQASDAEEIQFALAQDTAPTEETVQTSSSATVSKTVKLSTKEASPQTETVITPTLEAVATLTPGDAAEATVAAQQEMLALVFEFGTTKDLCTSDVVQTQKQGREVEMFPMPSALINEEQGLQGAEQALRQDAKAATAAASADDTTTDFHGFSAENTATVAGDDSTSKTEDRGIFSHEVTIFSEAKILSSIAFVTPDPFFTAKNTAAFFVGFLFLTQSKNESATAKSREQDLLDGESARTLHTVTRQDSSNLGSDSSHHQDNGTAEGIAALDSVTADDENEFILDDAVAAPVYTDTVVIL